MAFKKKGEVQHTPAPRPDSIPRYKNWKLGESRVTAEVITAEGGKLELMMPHLTKEQGEVVVILLSQIMLDKSIEIHWTNPKTKKKEIIKL